MSFHLLVVQKPAPTTFLCLGVQLSVRYAGRQATQDTRNDLIRRALYPNNIRSRESPTGTWRPDVARALQRAIPSKQAHETIERAWLLRQRHIRWKRDAESVRKFNCMWNAMSELQKMDPQLFREANRPEDPRARSRTEMESLKTVRGAEKKALEARLPGLFPREMRVPTDTPPRSGWNYEWKPSAKSVT